MMNEKELIGKTFGEACEILSQMEGTVKIGCKESSAFIFCGEKKMLAPNGIAVMESYTKDLMVERVKNSQDKIEEIIKSFPSISAYVMRCWRKKEMFGSLKDYIHELYKHWKSLESVKSSLLERREQNENRTVLTERKVLDAYPSALIPNQVIIIIEGYETAGCWDIAEYKEFMRHKKIAYEAVEEPDGDKDV